MKEKIVANKGEWFTFPPKEVAPSFSSVQRMMGVPKEVRDKSELALKQWKEVSCLYKELVRPAGVILIVNDILSMANQLFVNSKSSVLYKQFISSKKVFLFLATIGSLVEERAAIKIEEGEYLQGGILDAMASCGVELVVDCLQHVVADSIGHSCVRFSPGYGGWKLDVQPFFLHLLDGTSHGISINDSFLFTPHKTVSGVIIPRGDKKISHCTFCDTTCCKK